MDGLVEEREGERAICKDGRVAGWTDRRVSKQDYEWVDGRTGVCETGRKE